MSGTAVRMTAEHLGRILGLFPPRGRLPAAVEMEEENETMGRRGLGLGLGLGGCTDGRVGRKNRV